MCLSISLSMGGVSSLLYHGQVVHGRDGEKKLVNGLYAIGDVAVMFCWANR